MNTAKFTQHNLPQGPRWDAEGACFRAATMATLPMGWYWQACNAKALAKGYQGQELFEFYPVIGGLPK